MASIRFKSIFVIVLDLTPTTTPSSYKVRKVNVLGLTRRDHFGTSKLLLDRSDMWRKVLGQDFQLGTKVPLLLLLPWSPGSCLFGSTTVRNVGEVAKESDV